MLTINKIMQRMIICSLMMILAYTTAQGQVTQPTWWFGVSGAANFNYYNGTTQTLDNSLIVPTAFHNGFGVRPYASILAEYRPKGIWGAMLNVGYDGRGAKYNGVVAPCNCDATLHTDISYLSVEPSLRLAIPSSGLYFFAGPRVAFNLMHDFAYTQVKQPNTNSQLSAMHKTVISGQVGAGYEIPLSSANSVNKIDLSPFISYQPYFGQEPRSIESLTITTFRAGMALKFGKGHRVEVTALPPPPMVIAAAPLHVFTFTVRGPVTVPYSREVSETFPLINAVFFDEGSTEIPSRYVLLTNSQASTFKEKQLQQEQTANMPGRSTGQLFVYHNVLNIVGDRMRSNPGATISLNGASVKGPEEGKAFAASVKNYLVTAFGIDGSRIAIEGSNKPYPPSTWPGGTKDLDLLGAENRRVDIESTSPELLLEVGGGMMKPVQMTAMQAAPLDNQVVFDVDSASQLLKSWSINVTAQNSAVQHYGPYTGDRESVPAATILGDRPTGDYTVTMQGETNNGRQITKEGSVHLVRQDNVIVKGFRYSILFNYDRAATITAYDKFLTTIVAPSIADGSTVMIHGHTDIVGTEEYNQKLSDSRAQQTQSVLGNALTASGKNNVKFETTGFGEDASHSPFENNLPEDRFYNRTVIIDIVPANK